MIYSINNTIIVDNHNLFLFVLTLVTLGHSMMLLAFDKLSFTPIGGSTSRTPMNTLRQYLVMLDMLQPTYVFCVAWVESKCHLVQICMRLMLYIQCMQVSRIELRIKGLKRKFKWLVKCIDFTRPKYSQFFWAGCLLTKFLQMQTRLHYGDLR